MCEKKMWTVMVFKNVQIKEKRKKKKHVERG